MTVRLAARRKLVYVSGTRADFGLMASTLLQASRVLDLGVAVTGMHLDIGYGHTVEEVRASGLAVVGEVAVDLRARSPRGMAASVGTMIVGLSELLERERPDMLLLMGDRGEMLAGAVAALHLGIPTVHVHGGERSGTVDEPVRHAISKLCTYHCVATVRSRERLVRMGEAPDHIFVTGAPGLDGLSGVAAMPAAACRDALGLHGDQGFVLALFHPVVQQADQAYDQTMSLLAALSSLGKVVVWLDPNSDAGSLEVLRALDERGLPAGSVRVRHLPRALYCAAMRHADVLVGNSSSGIIEAATFGTPVVNVGDRQRLRERNANVTDVDTGQAAVTIALREALRHGRWPCDNVYGDDCAGERIVQLLCELPLDLAVLEKINTY